MNENDATDDVTDDDINDDINDDIDDVGAAAAAAPILATRGLSFSYGKTRALDDVSVSVPPGRFVALLGANGAGKSTLFSIITGLYSAHGGSVTVGGFDLRRQTLLALAGMGVVFQRSTLDTDLTVTQNLQYSASLQGIPKRDTRERIAQSLQTHSLGALASRKITVLSGGERRRVELARALLHRPALVLLDEPTVGLDMQSREEFVSHVKQLCREQGAGVLWATHLMDEVADDDLVYVMHKGRIIANGQVDTLKAQQNVTSVAGLFNKLLNEPDAPAVAGNN